MQVFLAVAPEDSRVVWQSIGEWAIRSVLSGELLSRSEQVAAPDGGRITIFRGIASHQRPPRVSLSFGDKHGQIEMSDMSSPSNTPSFPFDIHLRPMPAENERVLQPSFGRFSSGNAGSSMESDDKVYVSRGDYHGPRRWFFFGKSQYIYLEATRFPSEDAAKKEFKSRVDPSSEDWAEAPQISLDTNPPFMKGISKGRHNVQRESLLWVRGRYLFLVIADVGALEGFMAAFPY